MTTRVAIAQLSPVLGAPARNLRLHLDRIAAARAQGAALIVFPELSLTGYFLKDLTADVAMPADHPILAHLADASRDIDVVAGYVALEDDHAYIAAGYWSKGRLLHRHHKAYLPTYGMFEEGRFVAPGSKLRAFDAPLGRSAMLICEDLWHPSTVGIVSVDGADLLIGIAASPARGFAGDRPDSAKTYEQMTELYARLYGLNVLFANRVGFEDGIGFWGGSRVVDPFGTELARAPYFEEALVVADLDLSASARARRLMPLTRDERPDLTIAELQRVLAERA